jgi:hypothetical protein
MAEVCGPFTLEQLDAFGSLDSLAFSLDNAVWTSADVCILEASSSVTGTGSTSAFVTRITESSASVSGAGTTSGAGIRVAVASASVSGQGSSTGEAIRMRLSSASVLGEASTDALGGVEYSAEGIVIGYGEATTETQVDYAGLASTTGTASCSMIGIRLGENWSTVTASDDTWTDVPSNDNTWTEVSASSNSWSDVSVGSNTWTNVSTNSNTWLRQ